MKKHHNYFLIFISLLFLAGFSSCQYENPYVTPINPQTKVSFSKDIQPIFTGTDNCVACHDGVNENPDLKPGSAYQSIMSMNLVDTTSPESSLIYWEPNPDNTAAHTWQKYSASEAALILQWIKQGAKDN